MTRARKARLKALFLQKFAEFGVVTHAAEGAGIDRRLHYKWINSDEKFRLAFEEADKQFTDSCIKEAVIRGQDGRPKPTWYSGPAVDRREWPATLWIAQYQERSQKIAERHCWRSSERRSARIRFCA